MKATLSNIANAIEKGKCSTEQAAQRLCAGTATPAAIAKIFYAAELQVNPELAVEPTPQAIRAARNKGKLRWRRIAVYSGLTEAQVRKLYGVDKAKASYVGRGRNYAKHLAAAAPAARRQRRKATTRSAAAA